MMNQAVKMASLSKIEALPLINAVNLNLPEAQPVDVTASGSGAKSEL